MASGLQSKVVELDKLESIVRAARSAGRTIVQCHGCFDIVHPGHIRYLEFARQQGDVLIVSLTGDLDVNKGDQRPYIPQELRAENLAALMFVDYVYINAAPTAQALLGRLQPNVYVKGREYERSDDPRFLREKEVVEQHGGRVIYSSGDIVFSSSTLIDNLPRTSQGQSHRLGRICSEGGIHLRGLETMLESFRGLHVLVVGDVVLDRYVLCDALGVASEAPMMTLAQRDELRYVGGAAIVARHIAALGGSAFLLSAGASAENHDTKTITDVLGKEGVECHLIDARPSIVEKTRFLADDRKLLKVDRAQRIPLDSVAQRRAALIMEQHARSVDAVILCDFGYGMITASLLNRVLPTLRQNVRTLTADVSGGRANLLNFKHVDLLCPTEREVRAMLNDHDSGLSSVAWELLRRTQARHLLVTLEKRGMLVFERRSQQRDSADWSARLQSEQLPAFTDHAVDHLGCGDALLAASTLALASGATLMQSAYLGNAAAAIEASLLGNHPVEVDVLREWLRQRRELTITSSAVESPTDVNQRASAIAGR